MGDISSLDKDITAPEGHSFDNRIPGHTVFYGRDRDETNVEAKTFASVDEAAKHFRESWAEYAYLFDLETGKWQVKDLGMGGDWKDLGEVLSRARVKHLPISLRQGLEALGFKASTPLMDVVESDLFEEILNVKSQDAVLQKYADMTSSF